MTVKESQYRFCSKPMRVNVMKKSTAIGLSQYRFCSKPMRDINKKNEKKLFFGLNTAFAVSL